MPEHNVRPTDVFPRRNLPGSAEQWGRTVEDRLVALEKLAIAQEQSARGANRSTASQLSNIQQSLTWIVPLLTQTTGNAPSSLVLDVVRYNQALIVLNTQTDDAFSGTHAANHLTAYTYVYTTDDGTTEWDVVGGFGGQSWKPADVNFATTYSSGSILVDINSIPANFSLAIKSATDGYAYPAWQGSDTYIHGYILYFNRPTLPVLPV